MLNITNKSLFKDIDISKYESGKLFTQKKYYKLFNWFSILFLIMLVIILFLPWTQSVTGKGSVTTLQPDHRPQTIQSPIPGRIEQWFVQEGEQVRKGDTILRISEVKSDYFDDKLVERTGQQIQSKSQSAQAYQGKVGALNNQIKALKNEQKLKLEQAKNKLQQAHLKVKTNSIDLEAAKTNKSIAETQYNRMLTLQEEGLKATKDVEEKRLKLQETEAKLIAQENKLLESKNEVVNAEIELSRIDATYGEKISKALSDLHTAQSAQFSTEADIAKLENSYSNYAKRSSLQYVTAPQNGFINRAIKGGVGVTFKEGESLVDIMPDDYELAVETYVRPTDLPLIHVGERVQVEFDGWPAIVFSGWESVSYGTYSSRVVAIGNYISENGMYRVLLAPDENAHDWPEGIRVGSGVRTLALLEDVPIWYELWRQINGFPPNFYRPSEKENSAKSNLKVFKKLK